MVGYGKRDFTKMEKEMIDYLIANKSIIKLLILSSIGLTSFVFILMVAIKK